MGLAGENTTPQPLALHFFCFISDPFALGLLCVLIASLLTMKARQNQPALRILVPMLAGLILS